jgi:hypothetical protein
MWVPVLLGVFYLGWVFWQRHAGQAPTSVPRDPMAAYGNRVKVLQFYTGARGRRTNAKLATRLRVQTPASRMRPGGAA